MTTKSYVIYMQGNNFPEVFNILKERAEDQTVGVVDTRLFTLRTTKNAQQLMIELKEKCPDSGYMIVEVTDFAYSGPGDISSAASILHG